MVEAPEYLPAFPIPGEPRNKGVAGGWPEVPSTLIVNSNRTFASFCALWKIAAQSLAFFRRKQASNSASIAFALSRYEELLSIVDGLSGYMTSDLDSQPHVLVFQ